MDAQKRKIGLYGGSFNPIHAGHIQVVCWMLENTDLAELWVLVTPLNPLKEGHTLEAYNQRLEKVREAFIHRANVEISVGGDLLFTVEKRTGKGQNDNPIVKRLVISDIEAQMPIPNYTFNTLNYLEKHFPYCHFVVVIGEDNWAKFKQWYEWERIVQTHQIYVYPRHYDGCQQHDDLKAYPNVVYFDKAPYIDLSSTEIRRQQGRG